MNKDHSGKDQPSTGFSALSSQISEVDDAIAEAAKLKRENIGGVDAQKQSRDATSSFDSPANERLVRTGSENYIGWWIVGIVSIGLAWAVLQSTSKPDVPAGPQPLSVSKPAAGSGQSLTTDEIRYCLAEKIRIDAAQLVVDGYNWPQVDRFNAMVADYNSRCGEFQYRPSSMSIARDDVDAHRAALEQEGRDQILHEIE